MPEVIRNHPKSFAAAIAAGAGVVAFFAKSDRAMAANTRDWLADRMPRRKAARAR